MMTEFGVGIVVIGLNEGEHLIASLTALRDFPGPKIYVDSGSNDLSVERARSMGFAVIELESTLAYTAARARNAGFHWLLERCRDLCFVQFVDGDSVLANTWLAVAAGFMADHSDVGVACGKLREQDPRANVFHRLAEIEWDSPTGDIQACGGISMIRASALTATGGFDESLIAGEEPELCLRIRRLGLRVVKLDAPMAVHDIAMKSAWQWWQRTVRGGFAYADGVRLHGLAPERYRVREFASILWWAAALPIAAIAAIPWLGFTSGLALLVYARTWLRIRDDRMRRGDTSENAGLFASACVIGKFAQLVGVLQCVAARIGLRLGGRLIEHKTLPPGAS